MAPLAVSRQNKKTSLQRIQRLEQDYPEFRHQLEQVADIIEEAHILDIDLPAATNTSTQNASKPSGKHEWALKWIVNKLRAPGEDGKSARATLWSWTLVANLIPRVQTVAVAKILGSAHFFTIVQQSLNENVNSDVGVAREAGIVVEAQGTIRHHDCTLWEPSNRKRKRHSQESHSRKRKKTETEHFDVAGESDRHLSYPGDIFELLALVLIRLNIKISAPGNADDRFSSEYLKVSIKLDCNQTAKFLGSWLMALSRVCGARCDALDPGMWSLAAVIQVWEDVAMESGDGTDHVAESFSKEALLPACTFLATHARLNEGRADAEQRTTSERVMAENVSLVETLIAKHVFVSAKRTRSKDQDINGQKTVNSQIPREVLARCLEPLRSFVVPDLVDGTPEPAQNLVATALPILMEIAAKSASLSVPRLRLTEHQWLENVFVALIACLGIELSSDSSTPTKAPFISCLDQLLQIPVSYQLKLERNVIQTIVERFSGILSETNQEIRWSIIAKVIRLDPNLFIDGKLAQHEGESPANLASQLMASITRTAWSRSSGTTKTEKDATGNKPQYASILNDVVIPFLQGYAVARKVEAFIDQWYEQLVAALSSIRNQNPMDIEGGVIEEPEGWHSIWEDQTLRVELTNILESSLTLDQISKVVDRYVSKFQETFDRPLKSSQHDLARFHQLTAIGATLRLLFLSLSSDRAKLAVVANVEKVLDITTRALESSGSDVHEFRARLWLLAAASSRLVLSVAGADQLSSFVPRTWASVVVVHTTLESQQPRGLTPDSHSRGLIYERLAAISCVGSLMTELRDRNITSEYSNGIVLEALKKLWTPPDAAEFVRSSSKFDALAFANVVAKYPRVLKSEGYPDKRETDRKDVVKALAILAMNDLDQELGNGFFSCWQTLLQLNQAEETWLRDDIWSVLQSLENAYLLDGAKLSNRQNFPSGIQNLTNPRASLCARFSVRSYLTTFLDSLPSGVPERLVNLFGQLSTDGRYTNANDLLLQLNLVARLLSAVLKLDSPEKLGVDIEGIVNSLDAWLSSGSFTDSDAHQLIARWQEICFALVTLNLQASQGDERIRRAQDAVDFASSSVEENPQARIATLTLIQQTLTVVRSDKRWKAVSYQHVEEQLGGTLLNAISRCKPGSSNGVLFDSLALEVLNDLDAKSFERVDDQLLETAFSATLAMIESPLTKGHECLSTLTTSYYSLKCRNLQLGKDQTQIQTTLWACSREMHPQYQRIIEKKFDDYLQSLEIAARLKAADNLLDGANSATIRVVEMLLMSSSKTLTASYKAINAPDLDVNVAAFSSVFSRLCDLLARCAQGAHSGDDLASRLEPIRRFKSIADSTTRLLSQAPRYISQSAIETVLASLNEMSSAQSPSIHPIRGAVVFSRLCRSMTAILLHHRKRLRGRVHLLIPILQNLLRCFFIPNTSLLQQQSWISGRSHPLTVKHASSFTRLITLLCEPTAYSVQQRRSASGSLTDETRRARRYAGQYVPLLLLEYAQCLLRGRLPTGVREALAPGVYAMFDAAAAAGRAFDGSSRGDRRDKEGDVLAAMNASASNPARTVLRGLWGEYKKFGKWNEH